MKYGLHLTRLVVLLSEKYLKQINKNYLDDKNRIMKLNISIYENLMYKDPEVETKIKKESSIKEKNNDKEELY